MHSCLLMCAAILAMDWNPKVKKKLAGCWNSLRIFLLLRNLGLRFSNTCSTPLGLDVCGGIFCTTLVSTNTLSLLPLLPPAGPEVFENCQLMLNYLFLFVLFGFWWCGLFSLVFNSALSLFWIMGRFQHEILRIVFILMGAIMISNSSLERMFLFSVLVGLFLFSFVFFVVSGSSLNRNYSS